MTGAVCVASAERVLLTLWVGSLWAVGYIAAPTLFAVLDNPELAGSVAGELFTVTAWVGLVCGTLLTVIQLVRDRHAVIRSWRFVALTTMLALTVAGEFLLRAWMDAARGTDAFGSFHGLAQATFLIVALLGLALVAAVEPPGRTAPKPTHTTAAQSAVSSRYGSGGR